MKPTKMKIPSVSAQLQRLDLPHVQSLENAADRPERPDSITVHGDRLDLSRPAVIASEAVLNGTMALAAQSQLSTERKAEIEARLHGGHYATSRANELTADAISRFYS